MPSIVCADLSVQAMTTQSDKERLLSILHAHGQQFLSAFDIPSTEKSETNDQGDSESEESDEWKGIGSSVDSSTSKSASNDEDDSGSEQEDDGFTTSSSRTPDVTVFVESTQKRPETSHSARELRKSFMSSKVSNVTSSSTQPIPTRMIPSEESDEERTNAQNDTLLHRLVHTKLLSGSLNPELDLDHAQRGRALAGRVLELAGAAKLGKGENVFRREERNKAAKHVREGLTRKQKEQGEKALEEAKNLGNYHPTLKRLYDSSTPLPKKKRARGLGMGVGKFVGGTLKLSREDIVSVTGSGKLPQGTGRRKMYQRPR